MCYSLRQRGFSKTATFQGCTQRKPVDQTLRPHYGCFQVLFFDNASHHKALLLVRKFSEGSKHFPCKTTSDHWKDKLFTQHVNPKGEELSGARWGEGLQGFRFLSRAHNIRQENKAKKCFANTESGGQY